MMQLDWENLRLFLMVAETGSLSAAARRLRLGQPTLSRRIAELEESVGASLFIRQTHGCMLTPAGDALLPSARRMAEWAAEASNSLIPAGPSGKVRIAAPPAFAVELLAPLAARLRRLYPTLQIEILSSVAMLNLALGEADISLRTRAPSDADLLCIAHAQFPLRVYAHPDYAATLPAKPTLAGLDWICWAPPYQDLQVNRLLASVIPNFCPAFTSDDFNVQLAACRAGVGAMALITLNRESQLGELVALNLDLSELAAQTCGDLYLVVHKRQHQLPRVQCVIDAICSDFTQMQIKHIAVT